MSVTSIMRVHELAKKLGVESRKLIPELVRLGIEVTSHSNALDEADVQKATRALQGKHEDVHPSISKSSRSQVREKKSPSKTLSRATKSRDSHKGTGRGSSVAEVEAPPKPEKKRILFKRKKEEEVPVSEPPVIPSEMETAPISSSPEPSPVMPVETAEPPIIPEVTESAEIAALPPGITIAPSVSEGVSESKPGEASSEGGKSQHDKHEGGAALEKEEKIKKVRKPGRKENEDLFAARYEDAARWQDLRPLPTLRREERSRHVQPSFTGKVTQPRKKTIKIASGVTVKEFAELISQRPAEVIRKLMEVGLPLSLNQPMNLDAGALIAEGFGINVEISQEKEGDALLEEILESTGEQIMMPRSSVVTIMGHVDHGKTTLLDAIRKSRVTEREAGGITQHIGAYSVNVGDKRITFLDTPGHEAFTAMRARGAQATDIVVLVVAADDGVMPQTIEAANHAKAGNVPIIVAINKMDMPGAHPDRVKQELSEHGLIPESWGGQTIYVEVSAKQQTGLDVLLDMILLQAEVLELKADVAQSARGIVLEAKLDRGRGPVATILVQGGILRVGATFVVGTVSGRVRALVSHDGTRVQEADPSTPVEVVGLLDMPAAGDLFVAVKDERAARDIAEARRHKQRTAELGASATRLTLDDLYLQGERTEFKELSLVVKADVHGSVGAICEALTKISSSTVKIQVLHSGVGGITESDILLASASGAIIIGFHVRPEPKASALAEREGVSIRLYTVIYNMIADIKAAAEGLLEPTITERVLGRAEVRQVFTIPRIGAIAGCYVTDGVIARASEGVRVLRDHVMVYEGKVDSLRRFKDDVREVQQGYECGIGIENFNDIKIGDVIEVYVHDKEATRL